MIPLEKAHAFLEAAAADLKALSFEQLSTIVDNQLTKDEETHTTAEIDGQKVYVSTSIERFGVLRKRIAVEMTLTVDGEEHRNWHPFIYFERFKSGRLFPSKSKSSQDDRLWPTLHGNKRRRR